MLVWPRPRSGLVQSFKEQDVQGSSSGMATLTPFEIAYLNNFCHKCSSAGHLFMPRGKHHVSYNNQKINTTCPFTTEKKETFSSLIFGAWYIWISWANSQRGKTSCSIALRQNVYINTVFLWPEKSRMFSLASKLKSQNLAR